MKLRNKKTGEIIETQEIYENLGGKIRIRKKAEEIDSYEYIYNSLAELNAEWEDVPTEEVWYLGERIGNYSILKKEARKATEKILAWKRLKDKGFRFEGWTIDDGLRVSICTNLDSDGIYDDDKKEMKKDLDTCFGGEE